MSTHRQWFKNASIDEIIALAAVEALGPASWQRLYRNYPSLEKALKGSADDLTKCGLTSHQADCFSDRPRQVDAAKRLMGAKKIGLLTVDDPDYPPLLKEITDPPLWLFYRGDLKALKNPALTVVGTRKPSAYALTALEKLLLEVLISQLTVVSGLAYGTDKKAHQLALASGAKTVAVLAGGLDSIYPADHARLADEIVAKGGLLLTEYPPLSRPRPAKFPIRNRIIAGLAPLTIVVEAAIRSGSLTTAASAIAYNRDIFAIPADITRPNADGTNFLIKQGAVLFDDPAQLADYYQLNWRSAKTNLDTEAGQLLNLLARQALSVDQIAGLTNQPIPDILGILTELELGGRLYQSQPGYYQVKKS